MFPQLASTAASFTRASSLVLKAGTDAHLYDDPHDADIVRLLDSKFDAEKVEALKRLLALISQGSDVSTFFPQVVKSVASSNLEVKKLVYIYLVHYAEKRPDEALLSINTFQKDLVDFNPLVRAWALRAMCGIRVHVVAPLMIMAVQKCAKDASPYVRRSAANAIPKLHALNMEQYVDALKELIGILLDDNSPGVFGAAAAAFNAVCPEHFEIIAPRFQELCRLLADVEEWGQVLLLDILLRYVVAAHGYPGENEEEVNGKDKVWHDRWCLLQSTVPLMWSHNSSVVLAAAGVHWILAPSTQLITTVKPLLFLLRSSYDTQYVVLANLLTLVKKNPALFEEHYDDFFVRSSDGHHVRAMKLEILALIATKSSIASILQELQAYVRDPDRDFAANAVSIIGKCAVRHPTIASTCMEGLLSLIQGGYKMSSTDHGEDRDAGVIVQAVLAIRSVAAQHFKQVEKVFARLIRDLDLIRVTAARAVVIWMVGEYSSKSSMIRDILPTVFSYLASCFVNEESESKLQILSCITKVLVQSWEDLGASFKTALLALGYVLDLGVCDGNYDVRDRARMLKHLLGLHKESIAMDDLEVSDSLSKVSLEKLPVSNVRTLNEHATNALRLLPSCVLTFSKLTPLPVSSSHVRTFLLGSMSHIVNHCAPGYRPLPEPHSFIALPMQEDTNVSGHPYSDPTSSKKERSQEFDGKSDYNGSSSSDLSNSEDDDDDDDTTSMHLSADNGFADSQASEDDSFSSDGLTKIHGGGQGNYSNSIREGAVEPLIYLSDNEAENRLDSAGMRMEHLDSRQSAQTSLGTRTTEDLESWLSSDSVLSKHLPAETRMPSGYLNLSMDSIKREPRKFTLLDFTNGEGLEVKYSFCFQNSVYYDKMVWVKLYLTNRSSDALSAISIKKAETEKDDVEPGVLVFPSPEVYSLEPHQVKEFDVHVDFQQQLVPVKLAVHCNQKCFCVKLVPDIGAFLRPKLMSFEEFRTAESKLVGMFEMTYRCSLERPIRSQNFAVLDTDEAALALARLLATRVLSQINVFLVMATIPVYPGAINDDVLNIHLKFSGETLVASSLCLMTITLEPQTMGDILSVLVKVNCEDSVFGLNLLTRLQKAITEQQ